VARQDFIQNVRGAVQFVAPRVEADNPYTRPQDLEKKLRHAAVWLTPRSVKGYRPDDFQDLPSDRQAKLRQAVEKFTAVAGEVPHATPATPGQVRAALPHFMAVVTTLQDVLRQEWLGEINQVLHHAEEWCARRRWPSRRDEKQIAEDFLGTYTAPRLLIAKDASRLILEPVARFVAGADGLIELAAWPAYDSARITRTNGVWYVHPVAGGRRRRWSEEAFVQAAAELESLA
jgi:hypothetical protein